MTAAVQDRGRRLWLLLAAACTVPAALDALQVYLQARFLERGAVPWRLLIWNAGEWLILGALTPLTYALGRRFPLRRPALLRNLSVHLGGALALCAGWAGAGAGLRAALGEFSGRGPAPSLASWFLTSLPWSVFMYFTVLGCVHAFTFFVEAREREAQLSRARLEALRAQLHPHFLFNSLNAIAVLVKDHDTRAATRMLELLSDVLRQVLRADVSQEVPLRDEIGFLRRYLAIEELRFSDRLRVSFSVDDTLLDAAVPPFVLQPLVENALRHGLARRSDAGTLEVAAARDGRDLVLSVRDDGPGLEESTSREGVGLANTRERLATLYPGRAGVTLGSLPGGGTLATVRLPHRPLEGRPGG